MAWLLLSALAVAEPAPLTPHQLQLVPDPGAAYQVHGGEWGALIVVPGVVYNHTHRDLTSVQWTFRELGEAGQRHPAVDLLRDGAVPGKGMHRVLLVGGGSGEALVEATVTTAEGNAWAGTAGEVAPRERGEGDLHRSDLLERLQRADPLRHPETGQLPAGQRAVEVAAVASAWEPERDLALAASYVDYDLGYHTETWLLLHEPLPGHARFLRLDGVNLDRPCDETRRQLAHTVPLGGQVRVYDEELDDETISSRAYEGPLQRWVAGTAALEEGERWTVADPETGLIPEEALLGLGCKAFIRDARLVLPIEPGTRKLRLWGFDECGCC